MTPTEGLVSGARRSAGNAPPGNKPADRTALRIDAATAATSAASSSDTPRHRTYASASVRSSIRARNSAPCIVNTSPASSSPRRRSRRANSTEKPVPGPCATPVPGGRSARWRPVPRRASPARVTRSASSVDRDPRSPDLRCGNPVGKRRSRGGVRPAGVRIHDVRQRGAAREPGASSAHGPRPRRHESRHRGHVRQRGP
ncbi:hypothetical protein ACVWWN_005239 [Mycobacterium sp. URHB0021]